MLCLRADLTTEKRRKAAALQRVRIGQSRGGRITARTPGICDAGNKKGGREAAATWKSPHSYPESRVPKEIWRVKGFLRNRVSFRLARLLAASRSYLGIVH